MWCPTYLHEKYRKKLKLKYYIQMKSKVNVQNHSPLAPVIQSTEELEISKYKYMNPFTSKRTQINEENIN